ncbi:MAG: DegT/DnrJ/EryC1/StrS family aminotransferase [Candidatus Eremiobacteraeota bacterium]|nr:DegT/DnrJ/EryC1/StrS family aminotransferase [Candidatus Eremiobacteraeota bacterium]
MRQSFLPYCRPSIDDDDIAAVVDNLKSGWLTTGPQTREFEREFEALTGVKHAVGLSSCTAGLLVGMSALGVEPGDEVVMPSLSFVAGAQCARQLGAKPIFCDVEPDTLCISPRTIEPVITARTRLIMPMHYAGRPARVAEIVGFARRRGIAVFEDAALACGMLDQGKWAGAVSHGAAYSLYATKNITSGEGGIFVTNDDALAQRVRVLALHGMDADAWKRYSLGGKWRYDVVATGYKCNLSDLQASLARSQLHRLSSMQQRRDELAGMYADSLASIPGVELAASSMDAGDRHSWCIFPILVDERVAGIGRDALIEHLLAANIGTSVHYIPTHHFSAFRSNSGPRLAVTERTWQQLVSLPLYPGMSEADVRDVTRALGSIVERAQGTAIQST